MPSCDRVIKGQCRNDEFRNDDLEAKAKQARGVLEAVAAAVAGHCSLDDRGEFGWKYGQEKEGNAELMRFVDGSSALAERAVEDDGEFGSGGIRSQQATELEAIQIGKIQVH